MQTKLGDLTNNPVKTGLVVNVKETKALNTHKKDLFTLRSENIEDVDSFTYLAVWVIKMGELHRMSCINSKSKWCFCTVWKNSRISARAKLRVIRINVKSVLLYGSETWKEIKTVTSRLQSFVNRCLRRILNICWTEVISNEELCRRTEETEVHENQKTEIELDRTNSEERK